MVALKRAQGTRDDYRLLRFIGNSRGSVRVWEAIANLHPKSTSLVIPVIFAMLGAAALSAQQQVPPANVTTDQSSPTLLVQTNLDCTFTVDDGETQVLKAGEIKRLPISLGEHLFTATSIDRKDQWRVVVNADKPLQKVVLIDLQKTRVERENAERSVSPSEQEAGGKVAANQGGQGIDTGVGGTTEASKRRAELTDQRVVLQKQIQAEQLAVQVYEAQARQFRASG